jgi:hypothetical protein
MTRAAAVPLLMRHVSRGDVVLRRSESAGGRPICFPWALARLLPSAVRVRIRSRSTSAKPPSTARVTGPVLVPVSAHGSAKDRISSSCPRCA